VKSGVVVVKMVVLSSICLFVVRISMTACGVQMRISNVDPSSSNLYLFMSNLSERNMIMTSGRHSPRMLNPPPPPLARQVMFYKQDGSGGQDMVDAVDHLVEFLNIVQIIFAAFTLVLFLVVSPRCEGDMVMMESTIVVTPEIMSTMTTLGT
jgi:hypothetical protein